ncbi:MAG: hypothetical protein Q9211_004644 [Gyalolechia sp. 1 TL-2023]
MDWGTVIEERMAEFGAATGAIMFPNGMAIRVAFRMGGRGDEAQFHSKAVLPLEEDSGKFHFFEQLSPPANVRGYTAPRVEQALEACQLIYPLDRTGIVPTTEEVTTQGALAMSHPSDPTASVSTQVQLNAQSEEILGDACNPDESPGLLYMRTDSVG